MKAFETARHAALSLALLTLLGACYHYAPMPITSIASTSEMKLLQSLNKPSYFGRAATSGTSAEVSLNPSLASYAPDLVVSSFSCFPAWPKVIDSGDSFTVVTKVKNVGNSQASDQSLVQFYLSANASYSSDDMLLVGGRTVPALESRQYSQASTTITIPAAIPSGKHFVVACADTLNSIAEKNEKNNCRISGRKIHVVNNNAPISVPLDYDVQVTNGSSTTISVPISLPEASNYSTMSMNLQDILSNSITIRPQTTTNESAAEGEPAVSMYTYILVGASAETVCQDGLPYGPFLIAGSASAPTVSPPYVAAEPSSVNIIKAGTFAMCFQIVSGTDASIHVGTPSVDATQCLQPPANISGAWRGTYTCNNHGVPSDINQPITLTITQDGNRAHYVDDGGSTFDGTVCGNVFRFSRTYPTDYEMERGRFVLNINGSATKTSTWASNSSPDANWGTCMDHLRRY